MLKSILAATDLSSRSGPAVQRAVQLAKAHQAKLRVLNVVEDDLLGDRMYAEVGRIRDILSAQVDGFGRPEACEVAVVGGHAFRVIGEEARASGAELIVMGAHRRQVLRDVFVGTTIERVIRTAGRPVLMANAPSAELWRRILVATDLSEASAHAAQSAHRLGLLDGMDVTFVHAFAPVSRQMMTHAGVPPERIHAEAEREFQSAQRELAGFVQRLGLGDLPCHARIIEGIGADAIAGFVEQSKPDLLVIGSRGLSGARRLFLGSVAQDLLGSLETDILAVPPDMPFA